MFSQCDSGGGAIHIKCKIPFHVKCYCASSLPHDDDRDGDADDDDVDDDVGDEKNGKYTQFSAYEIQTGCSIHSPVVHGCARVCVCVWIFYY